MSKITITLDDYVSEEHRKHLSEAAEGASKALALLGRSPVGTACVEVVRITLASWAPKYGHLYITMVLNNEGKKETDPSLVQDPSTVRLSEHVELWVLKTVNEHLVKWRVAAASSAQSLGAKTEHLASLVKINPTPTAP